MLSNFCFRNFRILCCSILFLIASTAMVAQSKSVDSIERILMRYDSESSGRPVTLRDSVKVDLNTKLFQLIANIDPMRAAKIAAQNYDLAQKIGYDKGMAKASNQLGSSFDYENKYEEALKWCNKSAELHRKLGDSLGLAENEGNIGTIYAKKGIYVESLRHMQKSLSIGNALLDMPLIIGTNNNIGMILKSQKKYDEALKYFMKAFSLQRNAKEKFAFSYVCMNVGETYRDLKKPQIAMHYFQQGVVAAQAEHDVVSLANNYSSIGSVYMDTKNYKNAFEYFIKGLTIYEDLKDGMGIFESDMNLSRYYVARKDYANALEITLKAKAVIAGVDAPEMHTHVYRQLSEIYAAIGNYKLAFQNQKLFKQTSDSLFNAENRRKLTEQQLNFEFKDEQEKRDRLATEALNSQRRIRNYEIAALTLIAILIIYLIVRRQRRKNREKQLLFDEDLNVLQTKVTHQEAEALALRVENENNQLKNKLAAFEVERQRQLLQEKLEFNQRELASTTLFLSQKNEMLSQLQHEIEDLPKQSIPEKQMERIKSAIQNNRYMDADWDKFRLHFEQVHPDYFSELEKKHTNLTTYELRLYAYLHMKLSTKEIASLLNIEPSSVTKAKVRLNKKLNQKDQYHE